MAGPVFVFVVVFVFVRYRYVYACSDSVLLSTKRQGPAFLRSAKSQIGIQTKPTQFELREQNPVISNKNWQKARNRYVEMYSNIKRKSQTNLICNVTLSVSEFDYKEALKLRSDKKFY